MPAAETLVYLTEYPTPILGGFDPSSLELPEEVLVTVMRHHQKYFSVEDPEGKLAPHFIAVMNIERRPGGLVRHGNERVLRARFNDARFFWERRPAEEAGGARGGPGARHLPGEARLVSRQDEARCEAGARSWPGWRRPTRRCERAALLAKCDLTTEMVKEFTDCRASWAAFTRGRRASPKRSGAAIYEHYKPVSMEDSIPATLTGAVCRAGRQARHACAAASRIGHDSERLEGSVRAAPRRAGRREDPGGRQAARLPRELSSLGDERAADASSSSTACGTTSATSAASRTTKSTRCWPPAATTWWMWRAGWTRFRPCGRRRTSSRWPPASSASRIFCGRREFDGRRRDSTRPAGSRPGSGSLRRASSRPKRVDGAGRRGITSRRSKAIASLRPKVDLFFDKVLVNAPDARRPAEPAHLVASAT